MTGAIQFKRLPLSETWTFTGTASGGTWWTRRRFLRRAARHFRRDGWHVTRCGNQVFGWKEES